MPLPAALRFSPIAALRCHTIRHDATIRSADAIADAPLTTCCRCRRHDAMMPLIFDMMLMRFAAVSLIAYVILASAAERYASGYRRQR